MTPEDVRGVADALMAAHAAGTSLAPISASRAGFDVAAAYDVLREIERRRVASGWRRLGRKIGFTNRTIWKKYGVDLPMWASVWTQTVHEAPQGDATVSLAGTVLPRIEPEVVFGIGAPVPVGAGARAILGAVEWIAPGCEIVQSHFPAWTFTAADCTASFGLHAALVVGPRRNLGDADRDALSDTLRSFEVTLRHGERVVDRGTGSNVLGSPALALGHLAQVLARQPESPPLRAGEFVTTGTITDAWPVAAGEVWSADYGTLGLPRLTLAFV